MIEKVFPEAMIYTALNHFPKFLKNWINGQRLKTEKLRRSI